MLKKLSSAYTGVALQVFNVLLLFLLANLGAWIVLVIKDGPSEIQPINLPDQEKVAKYQQIYPEIDDLSLWLLDFEDSERKYLDYEPFTQFKTPAFKGYQFNQSPNGYRWIDGEAEWPPVEDSLNIFLFGGSTMYGTMVPDNGTVAAKLQARLRTMSECKTRSVRVYNFGRSGYFSTQERILLESHLMRGVVPDLAIFVDGLNDFVRWAGDPAFTRELSGFFAERNAGLRAEFHLGATRFFASDPSFQTRLDDAALFYLHNLRERTAPNTTDRQIEQDSLLADIASYGQRLPLYEFMVRLLDSRFGLTLAPSGNASGEPPQQPPLDDAAIINSMIDTMMGNVRMLDILSDGYDFSFAYVLQPVPMYKYDLQNHLFAENINDLWTRTKFTYVTLEDRKSEFPDDHFIDLSGIQENRAENLYVDALHYTPQFADVIAAALIKALGEKNLLACQ